MSTEPEDWKRPDADYTYRHQPRQDRIERALSILARPGARDWFWRFCVLFVLVVIAAYSGLALFGFDNVMDRLGWVRPPIEQLREP